MIKGYKPNGYFVTYDKHGNKIEGETRQCAHCQASWVYIPDTEKETSKYFSVIPQFLKRKKIKRGFCINCQGLLCGKKECMISCAPFHSLALEMDKKYKLTSAGIFMRKK